MLGLLLLFMRTDLLKPNNQSESALSHLWTLIHVKGNTYSARTDDTRELVNSHKRQMLNLILVLF